MGIGGLGDWFKKRLDDAQGVYHQANMFDGGRTFSTNRQQVAPTMPGPGVRNRNVFQKGFDQVNIFDNGRSFETARPDPMQNFESNFDVVAPMAKSIVRAPAQMMNTAAAQIPAAYYTAGEMMPWTNDKERAHLFNMQRAANQQFDQEKGGLFNAGTFYNADDAEKGDLATGLKKIGGGTVQTIATVAPVMKGGSIVVGSQPLTKGLMLNLAKEGAGYGAAYSSGNQMQEKGSIDPKQLAIDTAMGAGFNVALPVAGRGIKIGGSAAVHQGANAAQQIGHAINNAPPLNQSGHIQVGGKAATNGLSDINAQVAKLEAITKETEKLANRVVRSKNQAKNGSLPDSGPESMLRVADEHLAVPQSEIDAIVGVATPPPGSIKVGGGKGAAMTPDAPLEVAPTGKASRFANRTVQQSDEVSDPLKGMVKDQNVTYTPHTNKERLAEADKFLQKKSNNAAYTHTIKSFENLDKVTDQDVVTAIQAAKRMDASGKEEDLFRATEIYDTLSRHLTAKGQEIQAASLLSNRTPQGLFYTAQKTLRKAGVDVDANPEITKTLKKLVDDVKKTKPGSYEDGLARFKVMDFVAKSSPSGAASKGVQLWKAGLLSAPTTTAGNLAANTAEGAYRKLYQDPVANAVDALMSIVTGKRSRSMTLRGLGEGAAEGGVKGVSYFKSGYDPRNPLQKFDVQSIHYSNSPAGKAAEGYTQTIFRLMGSQDQPFYYSAMRNSLYDQAITEAKNAGLRGSQRAGFVKKYITEPSKEALQLADDEARYAVFQNKTALGNLAGRMNQGPLGQFIIPFSQVPSSIATRMIERTPIGLGKEIISQIRKGKFDQRAMSKAVADSSAGIAILAAGAQLQKEGLLTTSYPTNADERQLWEVEGKQPNSIKIGNTWVSMNYFQPMGTIMAAGANYQKARDEGQSAPSAYGAAVAGASKAFTEQSFLKGVSGGLEALSDPVNAGEKFAENTAGSLVPNFIRSGARSFDESNRVQDGMVDSVAAGIPGLRQTLPEKTDMFGEVIPRKTSALSSLTNPLRPSDARPSTDLNSELRRLFDADEGVTATKIQKDALGDGVELNEDQQREVKNLVGQELKKSWDQTIKDGRYASLSDGDKRRVLEKVNEDIGAVVKAKYGDTSGLKAMDADKLSTNQTLLMNGQNSGEGMVDYLDNAADQTNRDNFANSSEKYQVIGDNVYYKAPNGDIVVKPKALYEYEHQDAQISLEIDRARGAEDLGAWMSLAEKKVALLEEKKKFYDPVFEADEIARLTLQQENLMEQAEKYADYGGFKKGKKGGGAGVNLPNISTAISSDLTGPVVSNSSYQAPKYQLRNKGGVKMSRGKSKGVKIKMPKRLG